MNLTMVHDNRGYFSVSGLIILSIISILMYYLHDLYSQEMQTVSVLQTSYIARNLTLSEASKIIALYTDDKTIWNEHCLEAIDEYDLSDGILVDEVQQQKANLGMVLSRAYLVHYKENTYILVIESTVLDITNQICIYLTKKDDELIVERWER